MKTTSTQIPKVKLDIHMPYSVKESTNHNTVVTGSQVAYNLIYYSCLHNQPDV